ncbi:MAG: glycosyltransferase family 2 protein [Paludibacteraceae bacterium]|nr:glycosyltransferase family 2 protein [Paludibacteraceae bacterium]MEE3484969.1 glycosyltransferase family 2 protein [Bacteroidales bacterium]
MVKVSVVVPIYNAGKYLAPCLDSLLNQTLKDIEVICVLDCPSDGSEKVVEEYAKKDDRVVVIYNDHNLHVGESRNVGIRNARGIYIGFSDHDDLHELDMYEKLVEVANDDTLMVVSGLLGRELHKYDNMPCLNDEAYLAVTARNASTHVTTNIYRRDFILDNHIFFIDNKRCSIEDSIFNSRVLSSIVNAKGLISIVPQCFYLHVDYGGNQNKSYDHWRFDKVMNAIDELYKIASETRIDSSKKRKALFLGSLKTLYTSFLREKNERGIVSSYRLIKNMIKEKKACGIIMKDYPMTFNGLSISKCVFAVIVKLICKLY